MTNDRYSRRDVLSAGLTLAGTARASGAENGPMLESDRWKLELTKTGAIARFVHKPSGLVLLEGGAGSPSYELETAGGKEDSSSAKTSLESISTPRGKVVRFRHQTTDKTVVTEIVHVRSHGGLEFNVRLENRTNTPVTMIRYPILTAPPKLGDSSEDDVMLVPALDGGIIEDPARQFGTPARWPSYYTYPGQAACQLVAYYDKAGGVYIAAHDSHSYAKMLGARRLRDGSFDFTISHLLPFEAIPQFEVAYPVILDSFTGDWCVAADKYRAWSLRQTWARERLADSKKVPAWLRKGGIVGEYDPNLMNLEEQRRWFEQVRDWFKVPFIPNNRGWEKRGTWFASDYLPPRPSPEAFRESAKVVKETGGQGMIMLSGYRWTIEKPETRGVPTYQGQERFDKEIAPHATCGKDGRPRILTSSKMPDYRGSKWARLCRKSEFAKRLNQDVARYCVEAGYPVMHWDQEVGGGYQFSACFSKAHGHPAGDGPWVQAEMEDLFKRFWKDLSPLTPDFALSMEQANEGSVPYLTMAQQRPFACNRDFPLVWPMTQTVPLFMYLHHEHMFGWAAYYPWRTTLEGINFSLAKGFSAGLMPAIGRATFLQFQKKSPKAIEEYLKLFQSCMEGYRGFAKAALMYGRMLRPLDLKLPKVPFQFVDLPPQSFPAVLNSVWLTPDGSTVIVLINHTRDEHSFEVDTTRTPGWSSRVRTSLVDASGRQPISGGNPKVTVPALSLRAIEFSNGGLLRRFWRQEIA